MKEVIQASNQQVSLKYASFGLPNQKIPQYMELKVSKKLPYSTEKEQTIDIGPGIGVNSCFEYFQGKPKPGSMANTRTLYLVSLVGLATLFF